MADTEAYEETRDAPSPDAAQSAQDPSPALAADGEGRVAPGLESEAFADEEAEQAGEVEVEVDLAELVKKAAQRDEYLALAQRTQADFENYRKRVARDSATAHERGVVRLAKELLPALDSLDRALEGAAQDDPLLDGVRLVRSELGAALGRVGIEAFAPVGEVFDPNEHEAVAQQPVEGAGSGTVAEVYQTGYRLTGGAKGGGAGAGKGAGTGVGATVIRPARVLVAA
jgi:molecular chaperone GrpE